MSDAGTPAVLVYKVSEAAKALAKGRNFIYDEVAAGRLPAIRLGRSIRIPKAAVDRLLEGKSDDAARPA